MATIERFEQMEVWQSARQLVQQVYQLTNVGAWARDFGLKDQIRRAAVSIMSAVAEGFEHGGDREFRRFLLMAKASAGEVRSLLYAAEDIGYMDAKDREAVIKQVLSVSRQLGGLIGYLERGLQRKKCDQGQS